MSGGRDDRRPPTLGDLLDDLDELEDTVDDPDERERVREAIETAQSVEEPAVFGRTVVGFDSGDAAESLLGALVFGIPMLVEGGTLEVGEFLATRPLFLLATLVGGLGVVASIIYIADFQDVRVAKWYLGVIPRRFAGVIGVSLLTALVMMTLWGRVDWAAPTVALSQVIVAFVPMAVGAALGDLLPG
ncbi:DUF2391 family protein [Halorientalis marina]|jgi:uncharacterized membrane protein|uniref:DUF2391 family protein n=1 Tax=Halorientalis marina TaxID=2931976 RepID=UPI001FF6EC79|nr:DUF2391 family protein [Halorientalis marina]